MRAEIVTSGNYYNAVYDYVQQLRVRLLYKRAGYIGYDESEFMDSITYAGCMRLFHSSLFELEYDSEKNN